MPHTSAARGVALLVAIALSLPACNFTRSPSRPVPALRFVRDRAVQQECLVVFLPGFGDGPDSYRESGFFQELVASGAPCDAVAVDAHFRYYGRGESDRRVYEDVLVPAVARGYTSIWLVGISMGGLGAAMLARSHPEIVDGIILLAPFLGDAAVASQVREAGGLARWEPPRIPPVVDGSTYTLHLWSWLRGYVDDPDARPPLYIGWGEDDDLGGPDSLLGDAQPEGHVFTGPGGHAWSAWRPLFRRIVAVAPIGR